MESVASLSVRSAVAGFLRYCASTLELVGITHEGAHMVVNLDGQLRNLGVPPTTDQDKETDNALWNRAQVASNEISRGFPLLHGHALLGAWGALEACVDDVCVSWLQTSADARRGESVLRLKVSLGEFLALDEIERWRWVVEQLKRSTDSTLKPGVGQFEALLQAIGLGGSVESSVREVLFYAKSIRNVLAHRNGRADVRLVQECPRLGLSVGDPVRMTFAHLFAALTAMVVYAELLAVRVERANGREAEVELPPWVDLDAMRAVFVTQPDDGDPKTN